MNKGLVGLVLGGTLAFGGEKTEGSYIETFDSPSALDSWVLSDSSKFQQTTFQGDGVLQFEQNQFECGSVQRRRGETVGVAMR